MLRKRLPAAGIAALTCLITVAFAALIAASEITVPQEKQEGKLPVNNPNDDLMFKKFGSPLAIDIGDGNERTLYLLEGNSPQDKSDPAHLTYYHDLALALVPRKERLPGYPAWFQTVINRENETVIDVRFRLSSPQLRAAAEAKLLSDERAFFDKKRQELGVPAIKVEVLPVPAYEMRLYIQDRASGLTLASAQENIRSWTKDVTLTFRFNKESLATFLNCEKEGTLRFTPYYKARADSYIMARKNTTVDYAVGLKVMQLLDHRQRPKLKNDDENTVLPILQDHVNKIARQVGAEIHSDTFATDPTVITFLASDTMLVSSCFDPATTMNFEEFKKAFPAFTDLMLAEYLKPYGVTKTTIDETQRTDGKGHANEHTEKSGGGLGFSLDLDPLALGGTRQQESADRVLDTIYNTTGVRLAKAGIENFYRPAEVKIYKLAQGYEEKKLAQASSITITKGPVQAYMDLSSFSPSFDVATMEKLLDATLGKNDNVTRLLAKKVELEVAVKSELGKIETARKSEKDLLDRINQTQREIHDAHTSETAARSYMAFSYQVKGVLGMARTLWGFQPPCGGPGGPFGTNQPDRVEAAYQDWLGGKEDEAGTTTRGQKLAAEEAAAARSAQTISEKTATLKTLFTQSEQQNAAIGSAQTEICRLQGEIGQVTKEILAILER